MGSLEVFDFLKVSDDKIWVSIAHQFAYYHTQSKKLVFPDFGKDNSFYQKHFIFDLTRDKEGNMWGRNGAFTVFKADAETAEILDTFDMRQYYPSVLSEEKSLGIWNLVMDESEKLWISGYHGVFIFDPKTLEVQSLPLFEIDGYGIESEPPYGMNISERGNVYITSTRNGLQIIDKSKTKPKDQYYRLTKSDGLPINSTIKVKSSKNKIWVTTRKGLVLYDEISGQISSFDREDGIPDNDLLSWWGPSLEILDDSLVFFGNPNKIVWFNANKIYHNQKTPNLFFTGIKTQDQAELQRMNLNFTDRVQLASSDNSFLISYGMDD